MTPEQRARALIEAALAIFEQVYPRPTPQETEHNNPVWQWMARARAELATQQATERSESGAGDSPLRSAVKKARGGGEPPTPKDGYA